MILHRMFSDVQISSQSHYGTFENTDAWAPPRKFGLRGTGPLYFAEAAPDLQPPPHTHAGDSYTHFLLKTSRQIQPYLTKTPFISS